MPRLAWFSPLVPVKSGISQYNAELLPPLAISNDIDAFVDGRPGQFETPHARVRAFSAHDFIWKHRQHPYDLVVYQLGNAPCHDYMWAYLMRYPGLVVLHDGQLHHARGRMLLQRRQPRREDYRREFRFNHPDADPDLAELGAVGLLGSLTYLYPMMRSVVESSRSVLVHNHWLADQILEAHPAAIVDVVEMGVPAHAPRPDARRQIRSHHGIPDDAAVFTAYGKVTPEKRLRETLRALASVVESVPKIRLLVAGEMVEYYDLEAEAESLGIGNHVIFTGYLSDVEVDDYLAASDVCLCMRWPTSRETSASWLRCLAAGKPTISTDLIHTVDVATLDPRNWSVLAGLPVVEGRDRAIEPQPVGVSIDILDESHSLKLAIRRLATDETLRTMLGTHARSLWAERFRLEAMVAGYQQVLATLFQAAPARPETLHELPLHLRSSGAEHAEALVKEILGPEYHLPDAD
jgi:glycosyltransferase involved in cell wall biosynthesis